MRGPFCNQLITSILLTVFLVTGCSSLRNTNLPVDYPEETAQIDRRLQEIFAAAENKDFKRLDSYHFYGPKFTKFSGSYPERQDADRTRELEHAGLTSIEDLKMEAQDLKIDVFGDAAIATFILNATFTVNDMAMQTKNRATLVFVQGDGDWEIAHEHFSPIQ